MSLFIGQDNTTLTFSIPTGELTTDEVGNPTAVTSSLTVAALLRATDKVLLTKEPGIDEAAVLLEGWCIEPTLLPWSVQPQVWADCVWCGSVGQFYLRSPINPPDGRTTPGSEGTIAATKEAAIGTMITGWFQTRKGDAE